MDEIEGTKAIWKKKGPLHSLTCLYVLNNLRNAALVFNKIVNSNGVIQQLRIPNLAQNDPFLDLNLRFYIQID